VALQKEVHYFDWYFDRGPEWYSQQFTPQEGQREVGDATPTYSYYDVARQRMVETLPHAKIVLIVREPVSRAYSHFWHSTRIGYEDLPTFEAAISAEPGRLGTGQREHMIRHSYLDRGRYIDQIEVLAATYGPRLHVLTLDDLIADTHTTLTTLFEFLAVDPDQSAWILDKQKQNRAGRGAAPIENRAKPYPPINPDTRAGLIADFKPFNDRLAAWMGHDLSAWNQAD
jgi:hypothetical protein